MSVCIKDLIKNLNLVIGCPVGCDYCYARNNCRRFHITDDFSKPEYYEQKLKILERDKPGNWLLTGMSDLCTWKLPNAWFGVTITRKSELWRLQALKENVTAIYDSARKKVADALVNGKRLLITGGHFEYEPVDIKQAIKEKGTDTMRIAVTYENGEIFQHFGHTEQFKLYDVEDGKIVNEQIVDTNGSGHGALAGYLQAAKADALICGGIGMGAQMALSDAGIKLYGGVQGSADEAAKALAEGKLDYDPDAHCDHHGHHHDGDCGHEHCGEHNCAGN